MDSAAQYQSSAIKKVEPHVTVDVDGTVKASKMIERRLTVLDLISHEICTNV